MWPFKRKKADIEKRKSESAGDETLKMGRLEQLVAELESDQEDIRLSAAKALGEIGDVRAVDPLLARLQSGGASLRGTAAIALGKIGNERAVEPLIAALDSHPYSEAVASAAEALSNFRSELAVELLISATGDPDAHLGEIVTELLYRFGDMRSVTRCLAALKSEKPRVRASAAEALGMIRDTRAVEPLIAALDRRCYHLWLIATVAPALVEIDDERALARLIQEFLDPFARGGKNLLRGDPATPPDEGDDEGPVDPVINALDISRLYFALIASAAAEALGSIADERAVEPLLGALQDRDPHVREVVTWALDQFGDERAVERFIAMLQTDNPRVVKSASETLGRIGDNRAVEPLLEVLQSDQGDVRLSAAKALGEIGDARAVAPLIAMLENDTNKYLYFVQLSAVEALSRIGDERGFVPTLSVFHEFSDFDLEKDHPLIAGVAEALGTFLDERAVERLLAALPSENPKVAATAAKILGELGDNRAVEPLLAKLACESDQNCKTSIITALGTIGDERVIAALISELKGPSVQVTQAATEAINQFSGKLVTDQLIAAISNIEFQSVKDTLARLLGRFPDERAVEPLISVFQSDNRASVRESAIEALGEIGDERATKPLLAKLQESSGQELQTIIKALGKIGDDSTVEPLLIMLQNASDLATEQIAEALGRIGDERAIPPLILLLEAHRSWKRIAAACALASIYQSGKLSAQSKEMILCYRAKMADPHRDSPSCYDFPHGDIGIGVEL